MASRILFILKHRDHLYTDENNNYSYGGLSSGLLNSASFVVDMLIESGVEAKLVQVIDNNCIDREVTAFKPTHVIIEAYWCVPEKFAILTKLHPNVEWIIRNHSELPFLATEGIAINWTLEYLKYPKVFVSANSRRALKEMKVMARAAYGCAAEDKLVYLPNYYTFTHNVDRHVKHDHDTIHIGCFGAIRPMKNQLIQAVAAIEFAQKMGKKLQFHINSTRVEGNGNNCLKNIQALFDHTGDQYRLIEHNWMPHDKFVKLCSTMDIGLCVSFSETFCIVAADLVSMGVPVVTSPEVRWVNPLTKANPTSSTDIVIKMQIAWYTRKLGILQYLNKRALKQNIRCAKQQWDKLFG